MALKFSTTGTSQTIRLAATGTPPAVNLEYSLDGVNYQAWDKSAITFGNGVSAYIRGYDNTAFATTSTNCYSFVFSTSSKVTCEGDIADLLEYRTPVTEYTANNTFVYLFKNCTALVNTPTFSVKKLTGGCYRYMFYGCTGLTTVAELPADTVPSLAYSYLFYGCTSLVNPPALPAKTLIGTAYSYMFQNCSNLKGNIVLPAREITNQAYYAMFNGCSKINNITIYAETGISTTNLNNWVYRVASSGTIYIIKGTRSQYSTGASGIPSGWSVVEFEPVYDYIEVSEDELDFTYAGGSSSVVVSSTNSWATTVDSNWISVDTMTGEAGDTTVNITCRKYGGSEDRIGTITFAMENGMDCTVTITQTRMGLVIPTGKIIRGILRIN